MRFSRLTRYLAAAALLAAPVSPYAAEEHSAGLWHLSHLSDPVTGKFNYCAVENAYDNGLTLAFARNRDFNTNIVVSFPDKRLQDHSRYKMLVAVDNNPVRDMTAFSADPTILVLPLQRDRKMLDWLQKGKLLDLRGPQDSVKFALDGANDAFHKLQACVEQGLKDEAGHVATPGQSLKNTQIAAAEAAQPLSPDMVQPLPLPDSSSLVQSSGPTIAKPAVVAPAAAAPAAQPALQQTPTPAQPALPPTQASSPPPPAAPSAAMQRFLDKQKSSQGAAAAAGTSLAVSTPAPAAPPAKVEQAQPTLVAGPPERPAEPPQPVSVTAAQAQPAASAVPAPQPQPPEQTQMKAIAVAVAPVAAVPPPAPPQNPAKPVQASAPASLPDIAAVLKSAGITPAGTCRQSAATCQWHGPVETGSIAEATNRQPLLEAMLDDTDRREAACKGHFAAENGAPVTRNGVEAVQAVYKCDNKVQAVLYARGGEKTLLIVDGVSTDKQSVALATRQKIASSIGIATNYQ